MSKFSRRRFLGTSGAMVASAPLWTPGLVPSAYAADTSGYKAMICIFLFGGLDQADTILPFDEVSYNKLAAIRPGLFDAYGVGSGNTSRDRENLLELSPDNSADFGGRKFALPPEMLGMRDMFEAGDMAIVGNVGPLKEPTDKAAYEAETASLPDRLFSHNDQQSTWMSFGVEGTKYGWGGKIADVAGAGNDSLFTSIGLAGNDVFLSGENVRPFLTSGSDSGQNVKAITEKWVTRYRSDYDKMRDRLNTFYGRNDFGHQNLLKMDYGNISAQGIANVRAFGKALESGDDFEGRFPETGIGDQLRAVARVISSRGAFSVPRQVFYTAMGGFDTHSDQTKSLPRLLGELSEAVAAFKTVMSAENQWENVTLFTASDFGRTTIDNGDGTDHGWGGHQFVMGGDVTGRHIYGSLPEPDLSGPHYITEGGRLIPTVSVDEYGASLGRWFGLSSDEMTPIFPNLANFGGTGLDFV